LPRGEPSAFKEDREPAKLNGHARKSDRFTFTPFREITFSTTPPYVIKGLLPRIGVAVLWGKPKCGKTFAAFDMEMHVALGWPYRGRRVEQGTVLHIACEGASGLGARKEAWRMHHAAKRRVEEIDAADFHLCKETTLDLIRDVDAVAAAIAAQFDDRPIRIITVDTLNRSLNGSESKDEDMAAYIRAAVALADKFQCLVLIIHHCGYDTTHPRGHTSLIGAVDADLLVKKANDGLMCLTVENMRDGANDGETYSRLEVVEVGRDDNGDPICSCVVVPSEAPEAQKAKAKADRPLSPMALKFWEAFNNAGAAIATPRAESYNRPSITEAEWVAELDRRGILPSIAADADKAAKRSAQNRRDALLSKYRAELVAANRITCSGKIIWSVKKEIQDP